MTRYETNQMIIRNINKNLSFSTNYATYSRRSIMKSAHRLFKQGHNTFSEYLKQAQESAKASVNKCRQEVAAYKSQLIAFYTPEQYHNTEAYKVNQMNNAYNNGINLNKQI